MPLSSHPHPYLRPILALLLLGLTMHALKVQWGRLRLGSGSGTESSHLPPEGGMQSPQVGGSEGEGGGRGRQRLVVAHFMLGNTYPYTEEDWLEVFDLARATSLDGLVLNLGPEEWQAAQAVRAYKLLSSSSASSSFSSSGPQTSTPTRARANANDDLKLFLSLDMIVLPPSPAVLAEKVQRIIQSGPAAQLLWDEKVVVSTFSGHEFGQRWAEVKTLVSEGLGREVFLWPAFFMPPEDFVGLPFVDGTFAWNNAWPMGNHNINMDEDRIFLKSVSRKPYMAAVSPLFFTHYGREGDWAFNKNWIYRSDDLLLPTRFLQLLSLPSSEAPSIIQLISWNDYGESHYISPVRDRDAQPGSEAWTKGMDHVGFRWMAGYFARRWRGGAEVGSAFEDGGVFGAPESRQEGKNGEGEGQVAGRQRGGQGEKDKARVVIWYRPQVARGGAEDRVGPPGNAEWAQDLINVLVITSSHPSHSSSASSEGTYTLTIQNGQKRTDLPIQAGELNLHTLPFEVGQVSLDLHQGDGGQIILSGVGREITDGIGEGVDYNFWSGVWAA